VVPAVCPPIHAVDRQILRRRLDDSLARPLTLIVAPAGAGKSVLLAQWAATHPEVRFVWLELEAADDDPVRFSRRLLQGLGAITPEIADLTTPVSMHGGGLGSQLLAELEHQLSEFPEVIIVLDDLHHLSNAALVSDLGRLVELIPPQVHMVMSTRMDPPFAWSHYRLGHDLVEIRQSELALDEAESAELLERIVGRSLGADEVTALVNRTEGWAAGLQLAGMTLRLHPDPERFVTQFSGNDRLIADYLSEEVLQAQTESRRTLLLRCSVLDEMCADLVGHLTGAIKAQLVLEALERESMFLVPLDTHREWYRFHHLFRDLLRFRLRAEDPPAEARLLGQAAAWHLDRGQVSPAVEYLLRARDWDGALDLIASRGSEVFEQGQMATVIRWINEVPEPVRLQHHDVNLLLGGLQVAEGHAAGAEDILRRVTAHPTASRGERACAQTLLATLAQWRPHPEISIAVAARALDMLHDLGDAPVPDLLGLTDPQSLETMATISGGRAHFLAGNTSEARDWLERGLATSGATYSIWRVSGLGSLALLEAWCGSTSRAEGLADEALSIARAVGTLAHPALADAYLATTLVALERGEPRGAALSLHEGSTRAEANRRTQLSWISHLEQSLLQAADGQPDQALTTILSAKNELAAPPPPLVADRLLALHGRLLRLCGSPEQALLTVGDAVSDSTSLTFESAAASLTLGQLDRARKMIDGWPTMTDSTEPLINIEHLVLRAWLASSEDSTDEAMGHLARAMAEAERHSLVEVFVRAGPHIVRLISISDLRSGFRGVVLKRARQALSAAAGGELADPLTDREMEVLSYLPSRSTNTELAERCFVSVNTIKTHMAHIYRKLDVANRNGAIIRAQEIGLL
jgi:LuxR family transcriptional regulator, maltose regulon positive regulatory protein